jgi:hypothetical protein
MRSEVHSMALIKIRKFSGVETLSATSSKITQGVSFESSDAEVSFIHVLPTG